MKNENEIKPAFAMEVIEMLNKKSETQFDPDWKKCLIYSSSLVQSLLPKEDIELHPATPEMQADFKRNNPEMKLTDTVLTESEKQLIEEAFKNTEKSVMIKPEPYNLTDTGYFRSEPKPEIVAGDEVECFVENGDDILA
jgi:hypothetical protein